MLHYSKSLSAVGLISGGCPLACDYLDRECCDGVS